MAGLTACPLCECRVASGRAAVGPVHGPVARRLSRVAGGGARARRRGPGVAWRGYAGYIYGNESNSTQGHEYIFFDARGCNHHIYPQVQ